MDQQRICISLSRIPKRWVLYVTGCWNMVLFLVLLGGVFHEPIGSTCHHLMRRRHHSAIRHSTCCMEVLAVPKVGLGEHTWIRRQIRYWQKARYAKQSLLRLMAMALSTLPPSGQIALIDASVWKILLQWILSLLLIATIGP